MRRPGTPSSLSSFYGQSASSSTTSLSPGTLRDNVYSGNIKVSIRVKPPLKTNVNISTSQDGSITTFNDTWIIDKDRQAISTKDVGEFSFDNVFHGSINNSEIFDSSVSELVKQVMAGYNGTVFAYGMTGSGKTYSMQGSQANPGIIPLSVNAIFNQIQSPASDPSRTYTVKVSYLEIYNEHLHDLLAPQTPSEDIKLRDDPARGVRALGLREVQVGSPEELIDCIQTGDALRRTEGTEYNSKSSRSHAVVQITIESSPRNKAGTIAPRTSTLYLCDLAGSERAASQTERRKEGAYINKSLLTLGTVIARLSIASTSSLGNLSYNGGGNNNAGHIPYRDSKLTRLLQPALSGKSLVSVLCTVDICNLGNNVETISTLRFAARAKNIMVSAKRNEETADPNTKLIEKLLIQVEALKAENLQLRAGGNGTPSLSNGTGSVGGVSNGALISQIAQLEAENRILNERVEHLARLCDDNRLEELIGLGIDDDLSSNGSPVNPNFNGTSTPSRASPVSSLASSEYQDEARRKESEYKSYIAHLEKQLYLQEVQKRDMSGGSNGSRPQEPSSSTSSLLNFQPIRSVSSPTVASLATSNTFPQPHYAEIIEDMKEEIAELKESNLDKDRIISTLRSINKRKENLTALSLSSPGGSNTNVNGSATGNTSPSLYSSAYSRYYFSPSSTAGSSSTTGNTISSITGVASSGAMATSGIPKPSMKSSGLPLSVSTEQHQDDSTLTDISAPL